LWRNCWKLSNDLSRLREILGENFQVLLTPTLFWQFELIQSTTALFNTGWPLTTISDDPNNSGNRAGAWQYGDNFGGMYLRLL